MNLSKEPVFSITADLDWASEACISSFLSAVEGYGLKATVFATHKSKVLDEFACRGVAEVGLHPNFLPGSTHGETYLEVIDHLISIYPNAKGFRSHGFHDNILISKAMKDRGFDYDSNLLTLMQPGIRPIVKYPGLQCFPVYWAEGKAMLDWMGSFEFERFKRSFLSPGLKVLLIHPFNFSFNFRSSEDYKALKFLTTIADEDDINRFRKTEPGCSTFVHQIMSCIIEDGLTCLNLGELSKMNLGMPAN